MSYEDREAARLNWQTLLDKAQRELAGQEAEDAIFAAWDKDWTRRVEARIAEEAQGDPEITARLRKVWFPDFSGLWAAREHFLAEERQNLADQTAAFLEATGTTPTLN